MSTVSALNHQMSANDVKTRTNLIDIDKKIEELKETFSSQQSGTKYIAEILNRVSTNFGSFRDKSLRDSAKFDEKLREVCEMCKSLEAVTSEVVPRIEAGLNEHWSCIEGLSANVNTVDETLGK